MEHHRKNFFLQVICPVYNEEANIALFIERLAEYLKAEITDRFEIVCVDDGSIDRTNAIVTTMHEKIPHLTLLTFSRNFGKEAAITAGLDYCLDKGQAVLIIDVDFQHPFETIKLFVEKWQQGYDMVYGVRTSRRREGILKRISTYLFYRCVNFASTIPIPRDAGDFRLLDQQAVRSIAQCQERNRFMKGLYAWAGGRSCAVAYKVSERMGGKSSYNFSRLFSLALVGAVSFSSFPLYVIALLGVLVSLLATCYGAFILVSTLLFGERIPGFATLITVILFLGGAQIFCMGIIGVYVAKIFEEVKGRPNYVIRRRLVAE